MPRLTRHAALLFLTTILVGCSVPMQPTRSMGMPASSGAFACATRTAADFGYSAVRMEEGVVVLAKPNHVSTGRKVITKVMSLGTAAADAGHEDRFIVSNPERFLRIDVVGVLGSGSDAPPSDAGRRDAAAILAACTQSM